MFYLFNFSPATILEHLTFPDQQDSAVVISARKNIRKGDELTFDYRLLMGIAQFHATANPKNVGSSNFEKRHSKNGNQVGQS